MSLFDSGIIPVINEHIRKESEELRDYGDYWSASSAGYCMRLVIMRRLGVPPVDEIDKASTQRVFSAGHVFHEWIQKITKDAGLSIAQEIELQDEDLMIRGHFDDLVLIPPQHGVTVVEPGKVTKNGHLILYDYKTAHSKWFEYVKGRPISYYNKMQLGTYMYMLRAFKSPMKFTKTTTEDTSQYGSSIKDLTEARILKISKDDLRLHEQQLMWSPELENEVQAYWALLNHFWGEYERTGTLPDCTCLDHEQGFMGKRTKAGKVYNDYFFKGEPCSLDWYKAWKENNKDPLESRLV